jgi:hypothetical protein
MSFRSAACPSAPTSGSPSASCWTAGKENKKERLYAYDDDSTHRPPHTQKQNHSLRIPYNAALLNDRQRTLVYYVQGP